MSGYRFKKEELYWFMKIRYWECWVLITMKVIISKWLLEFSLKILLRMRLLKKLFWVVRKMMRISLQNLSLIYWNIRGLKVVVDLNKLSDIISLHLNYNFFVLMIGFTLVTLGLNMLLFSCFFEFYFIKFIPFYFFLKSAPELEVLKWNDFFCFKGSFVYPILYLLSKWFFPLIFFDILSNFWNFRT
jgi:hypothetical protein